jgi:two-component system response regulator YesN
MDDDTLVWLVQPKKPHSLDYFEEQAGMIAQLKGILEMIQEMCEKALDLSASFVVDGEQVPWEQVPNRFASLRAWVGGMPQIGGKGSILEYTSDRSALPFLKSNEALEMTLRQLKKLDLLESLLANGSKDECLKLLNEMLESVEQAGNHQPHAVLSIYSSLSLLFLSYIQSWGMADRLQTEVDLSLLTHTERLLNTGSKGIYLRRLAALLFDLKQDAHADRANAAVQYIQQYILTNLHQDLSLVRLAEVSHFNPSYLSRLFKQVAGVNLNTYIQDARVKKAMELLRDSSLKIHEIATQVGFEYPPYFTKMFKKNVHMNPQEYRDHFANK